MLAKNGDIMVKKRYLVLIYIIILIILFVVGISFYKFYIMRNGDNNKNDIVYGIFDVDVEGLYTYDIDYLKEYKNNILTDIVKEVEYSMFYEDEVLYGKVFIGLNNKLYLYDEIYNKNYLVLDKEVKTLYDVGRNYNFCSVYAITNDGELYRISLAQPLISTLLVEKINISDKVVNFTNLSLNTYTNYYSNSVVVLTSDGTMYDALTLTKYNPNTLIIMDKYIVYETSCISDINRRFLVNSKGENYKVKVIAVSNNPITNLKNTPDIIIVTEDDKLIYLSDDGKTYEYLKKVKTVGINDDNMIVVVFDDDKYIEFEGFYDSEYYSVLNENVSQ